VYTNWVTATVGQETAEPVSATARVAEMANLEIVKLADPNAAIAGETRRIPSSTPTPDLRTRKR